MAQPSWHVKLWWQALSRSAWWRHFSVLHFLPFSSPPPHLSPWDACPRFQPWDQSHSWDTALGRHFRPEHLVRSLVVPPDRYLWSIYMGKKTKLLSCLSHCDVRCYELTLTQWRDHFCLVFVLLLRVERSAPHSESGEKAEGAGAGLLHYTYGIHVHSPCSKRVSI